MTHRSSSAEEYIGSESCSLANAVAVVGERWTFFILREAMVGTTRFTEFRTRLGVAPDVLTARLEKLVASGIMTLQEYREAGQRPRFGYHLTDAGQQLGLVVLALQQWGDAFTPSRAPTSVLFEDGNGQPVSAGFLNQEGRKVTPDSVAPRRV